MEQNNNQLLQSVANQVQAIATQLKEVATQLKETDKQVKQTAEQVKENTEQIEFIKNSAVTKDDFDELKNDVYLMDAKVNKIEATTSISDWSINESRKELAEVKEKIMNLQDQISSNGDHVSALHNKLDAELAALRNKSNRLETWIEEIAGIMKVKLAA